MSGTTAPGFLRRAKIPFAILRDHVYPIRNLMSANPAFTRFHGNKKLMLRNRRGAVRYLRLVFVNGPKVLLTSRISGKCALVMTLMCMPSLLLCFLLTVPGIIFQSPQQHAYYYFSKVLNEDPTRWVALLLAGVCTLMALAIPATMSAPTQPIRY